MFVALSHNGRPPLPALLNDTLRRVIEKLQTAPAGSSKSERANFLIVFGRLAANQANQRLILKRLFRAPVTRSPFSTLTLNGDYFSLVFDIYRS